MFKMKRDGEKTVVYSDMAMTRHLEAGWVIDDAEEKEVPVKDVEPAKRGPKPKNREVD